MEFAINALSSKTNASPYQLYWSSGNNKGANDNSMWGDVVLAGYDGGANAYVRKPVSFSDFVAAVRTIVTFWLSLVERPPAATAPALPGGQPAAHS